MSVSLNIFSAQSKICQLTREKNLKDFFNSFEGENAQKSKKNIDTKIKRGEGCGTLLKSGGGGGVSSTYDWG